MSAGLLAAVRRADRLASKAPAKSGASAASAANAGASAGLVPYKTTHARGIELCPAWERIRRLRKRVRWSAKSIEATCPRGQRQKPAMLTLTYEGTDDWSPDHVTALFNRIRDYMRRKHGATFRYVWVAELQQRGAVHYHVLIWLPKGVTLPKPDKQGWWKHGSTRIEWARSPVGYLTKYASKLEGKDCEFPPSIRLHGSGGLTTHERALRSYLTLPVWLQDQVNPDYKCRPLSGGGYVSAVTGEVFKSPWEIDRFTFRPGVGWIVHIRPRSDQT